MRRCKQCIVPDSYPDITFDSAGICSKCQEHRAIYANRDQVALQQQLQDIFAWAKAQNKRYDCIVPLSGGRDSAYALHLCSRRYGLNVLAVNFGNGLKTKEARANIQNLVRRYNAGYVCYGPPWETMRSLFREFFLHTGQFCFPCEMGISATVQRVAEEYDVPLIVSGFADQVVPHSPKLSARNSRMARSIAGVILSPAELNDLLEPSLGRRILRRLSHFTLTRYRRQISLSHYAECDFEDLERTLYQESGLQKRPDGSSDHIGCRYAPIGNYLMVRKWGFGEKAVQYSALIRTGQISRDRALQRATEEDSKSVDDCLNEFMATFEITPLQVEQAREKSHLAFL